MASVAPVRIALPVAPVIRSVPAFVSVPLLRVPLCHCQLPVRVPVVDAQLPPSSVAPTPVPLTVPAKLPPPCMRIARPAATAEDEPLLNAIGTSVLIEVEVPAVLVRIPALVMLPPPVEELMAVPSACRSSVPPARLLMRPLVFR